MLRMDGERTSGSKLALAIGIAFLLSIPLFSIYLLNYDRQSQSRDAMQSITSGWGATQTIAGPVLVIPYRATATTTAVDNGQTVTRTNQVTRQLTLAPEALDIATRLQHQERKRSIYRAVLYDAAESGLARFTFPPDLARTGVDPAQMDLSRAELRFAVSDPRGLGANPRVSVNGAPLRLLPGSGSGNGRGFFGWVDASGLAGQPLQVDFVYTVRGNEALSLAPLSGDTPGRFDRLGQARASAAISFPALTRKQRAVSTPTTASAISRSAGHLSTLATRPRPDRMPEMRSHRWRRSA